MNEEKQKQLEESVNPKKKGVSENKHPRRKIIIESNSAELVEGTMVLSTDEFLVD